MPMDTNFNNKFIRDYVIKKWKNNISAILPFSHYIVLESIFSQNSKIKTPLASIFRSPDKSIVLPDNTSLA